MVSLHAAVIVRRTIGVPMRRRRIVRFADEGDGNELVDKAGGRRMAEGR